MTVTLITGGNRGLGRETARRLNELGHVVYIGARDADGGRAVAEGLGARFVPLDVTDDVSVDAAAATITEREGRLDVLINNAGVAGAYSPPEEATVEEMRPIFETNVFGIVRTIGAFLPLLRASECGVIVNVSSGIGSFGVVTDPRRHESDTAVPLYSASKAAVGMLTVQYAKGLPELRINAADPGFTATEMNDHRGPQTLEQGTDAIVRLATIGRDGPTGTFSDRFGATPW